MTDILLRTPRNHLMRSRDATLENANVGKNAKPLDKVGLYIATESLRRALATQARNRLGERCQRGDHKNVLHSLDATAACATDPTPLALT